MKISKSSSANIAVLNNQVSQGNQVATINAIQISISAVGQIVPIVMHGKTIIDGHKRLAACKNLGIEPKITQVVTPNDMAIWTSLNMCRTHMSQNERALIACELYRLRPQKTDGKKLTQLEICENLKISSDTVERVRKAEELAGKLGKTAEVMELLKQDKSPRNVLRELEGEQIAKYNLKAYCETNLKVAQELHEMATQGRKFSFIYADPPWAEAIANTPYPTMPTGNDGDTPNKDGTYSTICSMADDIKAVAAKDSVLWLWTTSSLLQNGLRVMEAWGFRYATMIVWAKSKTSMSKGAVLPKHELILVGRMQCDDDEVRGEDQDIVLVAKRGSGQGSPKQRIESVIEIPGVKLAHSQKPEQFAEEAEILYPTQAKLELFARRARQGWTTWGNQSDGKALKQLVAPKHGSQSKSAAAGTSKHRGRKPDRRLGRPATVSTAHCDHARPAYEMSDEFNRTKNILLNRRI